MDSVEKYEISDHQWSHFAHFALTSKYRNIKYDENSTHTFGAEWYKTPENDGVVPNTNSGKHEVENSRSSKKFDTKP